MFGLGFGEIIIILFIALLFIGPKKLPELAKSLGKGLKEFKKATSDFTSEVHKVADIEESKPKVKTVEEKSESAQSSESDQNSTKS